MGERLPVTDSTGAVVGSVDSEEAHMLPAGFTAQNRSMPAIADFAKGVATGAGGSSSARMLTGLSDKDRQSQLQEYETAKQTSPIASRMGKFIGELGTPEAYLEGKLLSPVFGAIGSKLKAGARAGASKILGKYLPESVPGWHGPEAPPVSTPTGAPVSEPSPVWEPRYNGRPSVTDPRLDPTVRRFPKNSSSTSVSDPRLQQTTEDVVAKRPIPGSNPAQPGMSPPGRGSTTATSSDLIPDEVRPSSPPVATEGELADRMGGKAFLKNVVGKPVAAVGLPAAGAAAGAALGHPYIGAGYGSELAARLMGSEAPAGSSVASKVWNYARHRALLPFEAVGQAATDPALKNAAGTVMSKVPPPLYFQWMLQNEEGK